VSGSESFDAFYRDTRQRLFDCLVGLTGDRAQAQDVVHEAYARAWQRWQTVGDYADPEAWVRKVARRLAVSQWRRARSALRAYRRIGPQPPVRGPDVELMALTGALRKLPKKQREAIVLHHLMELPVAQIAREIGVPEGTVKARLARGRRALAELLAVKLPEESHA
jgi:RNA polymerase sigma-70 factor (ECF subfamily)